MILLKNCLQKISEQLSVKCAYFLSFSWIKHRLSVKKKPILFNCLYLEVFLGSVNVPGKIYIEKQGFLSIIFSTQKLILYLFFNSQFANVRHMCFHVSCSEMMTKVVEIFKRSVENGLQPSILKVFQCL